MKKMLFLFLILYSTCANAQFKITIDGFVSEVNNTDYYIKEIPGKNAKELYNLALTYIMELFQNPNVVTSKIENELISIHAVIPKAVPCKKWMGTHYADVDMNFIFRFKDGKIRFDSPSINDMVSYTYRPSGNPNHYVLYGGSGGYVGVSSLFDKKGNVKNEMAVNGLNELVNALTKKMIEKCSSNNDW